ncbi:DUF1800 domain-containing protein [Streptomyces sp. col6]|uniref:DUF1800 domain-containing protein n=1 Tax=Streptomyces sp. col6 TaxID=2478958 RepID=UPI00174622E3|nr:DUF1800 domain-containing protein [Streptomyces sp. col6]
MGRTLDTRAHVTRLLQRTGFGAAPDAVDAAEKAGFEATLERVLGEAHDAGAEATPAPEPGPLPPRNSKRKEQKEKEGAGSPEPMPSASGAAKDPKNDPVRKEYRKELRRQRAEVTLWWLERMVAADRPWAEKRTLLWHNHWATSIQKVKSGAAMLRQNETLRRLGGGDFRTLARAMVVDPALMVWLDADGSTAKAPNENLGRELMELFVLGVGNYTETDVRQAAAALTGWTLDRHSTPWKARFRPRRHDQGQQTVVGETADFSARTLIDHLVSLPDSHAHVAGRMWGALVSNENKPSKTALARVTAAYGKNRDTTAMFRAMFTDDAFADSGNVLVKQPVEYVVGSLRALGVRPSKLPEKAREQLLTRTLAGLGQVPFAPESVGGWPAGAAWLTTSAAQVRIGFAQGLVRHADLGDVEDASAKERPGLLARKLGIGAWGDATRGVLNAAARDPHKVTALALTAPEHLVLS